MKRLALSVFVICVCATASLAQAQDARMVDVDGHQMRVLTIGLENAESGSPVVVFEAGFMRDGISAWRRIVQDVAEFAPIVAYDRAGIGESEPDGERPTPQHVAENLHALLGELSAEPPYVLVGHSLGGPFIRMFTALYPDEVVGLVHVDPTTTFSEEAKREMDEAAGLSTEDSQRLRELARQRMAEMPTLGMRAEMEVLLELSETHWPDFQVLPPVPDIPVSILMAARFQPRQAAPPDGVQLDCEPRECYTRSMKVRMAWLSTLAAEVTNGTLTVVTNSGHFIQNDDPDLVVWNIRRVIEADLPRVEVDVSPTVLAQYLGVYEFRPERQMTLTLEDGQLYAQITGQPSLPIFAESEDEFFLRVVDAQISFVRDAAEEVVELIVHQNGRDRLWKKVR